MEIPGKAQTKEKEMRPNASPGIQGNEILTGNEECFSISGTSITWTGAYLTQTQKLLLEACNLLPDMQDIRMRYEITRNYEVFEAEFAERLKLPPYESPEL